MRLGLADRVRFVETDLLSRIERCRSIRFVVSNPPYVSLDDLDCVQREVREFEPRIAWAGSGEGEAIYRRLFLAEPARPRSGWICVCEGRVQSGRKVLAMFDENWSNAEVRPDLAGYADSYGAKADRQLSAVSGQLADGRLCPSSVTGLRN